MTSTPGMSLTTARASSTRSSRENSGVFDGFAAIATTTRWKIDAARRMRSWWPLVIGSKVPG